MICPFCGGKNEPHAKVCTWCHSELRDQSKQHFAQKKQYVVHETLMLKRLPLKLACLITSTFLSLILLIFIGGMLFTTATGTSLESLSLKLEIKHLEHQLEKYYETGNYDGLEQLIIEEASHSLMSSQYFTYRAALLLHWDQEQFQTNCLIFETPSTTLSEKNEALTQMLIAYTRLLKEQASHTENAAMGYTYRDDIELALSDELNYETTFLSTHLNYDLTTLTQKSEATLKTLNWLNYLTK